MKSLKSIFALALIMLVAASCGKKDDAAAANAGKSETASLSEDAKAFVGTWEYGGFVEKLVLNLKADGKYEIEYYETSGFNTPLTKVATAGGVWNVTSTDIKRNVTDENGNTREVTEKAKVLEIKPDDSLLKLLCEEQNRERVKKSLLTKLDLLFKFEDGTGSLPNVRIEKEPYRGTVLKGDGYPGFEKVTEAQAKPAQEAAQAEETSSETLSFEGTVADKHVTGDVTLEGDTASGRYAYDGSSAYMLLSGSYDSILNILSLNESYDGNNTGTWNVNYDKDAKTIYGTMVNFKGKEYKVDLKVN